MAPLVIFDMTTGLPSPTYTANSAVIAGWASHRLFQDSLDLHLNVLPRLIWN